MLRGAPATVALGTAPTACSGKQHAERLIQRKALRWWSCRWRPRVGDRAVAFEPVGKPPSAAQRGARLSECGAGRGRRCAAARHRRLAGKPHRGLMPACRSAAGRGKTMGMALARRPAKGPALAVSIRRPRAAAHRKLLDDYHVRPHADFLDAASRSSLDAIFNTFSGGAVRNRAYSRRLRRQLGALCSAGRRRAADACHRLPGAGRKAYAVHGLDHDPRRQRRVREIQARLLRRGAGGQRNEWVRHRSRSRVRIGRCGAQRACHPRHAPRRGR
jgi:hypothetical protein